MISNTKHCFSFEFHCFLDFVGDGGGGPPSPIEPFWGWSRGVYHLQLRVDHPQLAPYDLKRAIGDGQPPSKILSKVLIGKKKSFL